MLFGCCGLLLSCNACLRMLLWLLLCFQEVPVSACSTRLLLADARSFCWACSCVTLYSLIPVSRAISGY
jgi:hypothetical protein